MKRFYFILGIYFLLLPSKGKALYVDSCSLFQEDPIVYLLDSISNLKYFEKEFADVGTSQANKYGFGPDSVPSYLDSIYELRLAKLDAQSPFDLQYNCAVRSYIDLYAVRKRALVAKVVGLSYLYYPLFEQLLDKYNLPLELKHLAVIESALNPRAKSRSGAAGLWQFMYHTGKLYGLRVTSYSDDRCDPYKATVAACEYFKFLYAIFGDWQMVLAAYNGGPGTVNKAIRRSGGKKTYWEIRPFLPRETQGYVPAFIAVNYVMNSLEEHNLYSSINPKAFYKIDTVAIKHQIAFDQVSSLLNLPVEEIQFLNPQYKKNIIPSPYNDTVPYTLCLPTDKIGAFISNEATIYNYIKTDSLNPAIIAAKEFLKIHTVKSNEKITDIALKYQCSVADIKLWNNLKSTYLKKGQQLNVYVQTNSAKRDSGIAKPSEKINVSTTKKKENIVSDGNYKYYTIQQGDTLWDIAKAHGTSVEEIKRLNNIGKYDVIKPGKKIKLGPAG